MAASGRNADRRFVVADFAPVYLRAWRTDRLAAKVEAGRRALEVCRVCPRRCGIDRTRGAVGICGVGRRARVASAFPHFGEEDCLRGHRGSGTIFFASCSLRCVFCQNGDISHDASAGREVDAKELAAIMLSLQAAGCHNVNLVTPTHVVPQIVEALALAIAEGLRLPLVYNTSAYDALGSLRLMEGLVDIYMPDFKFWDPKTARDLAAAEDYPARARSAICAMHRQVGPLSFGPDGVAVRGVLVRHLVMPGQVGQSAEIFRWLASAVSADTYVNVMGQYRPALVVGRAAPGGGHRHSDIDRCPGRREMAEARRAAHDAGLHRFDGRFSRGF